VTVAQWVSAADAEEQPHAEWPLTRLKYTVESLRNGVWGSEPLLDGTDVLCVRAADFDRVHLTVELTSAPLRQIPQGQLHEHLLHRGDLVLEKSGGGDTQPVGLAVRFDSDEAAVCSNFAARMIVGRQYSSRFLTYVHAHLYSAGVNTKAIKQSTGIQNLDADAYFDEKVPVPPIDEQRAIADFLDRETNRIDDLVAKKHRLIELLQEKRTALISHAVIKGLDPDVPMRDSGVDWLGRIPRYWKAERLAMFTDKITNGFVGPTRDILLDEGVPYLQSLHIKANRVVFGNDYFVSPEWSRRHGKSVLRPGDVLVVQTGDIGQVAVVPPELEGANCHALIIASCVHSLACGEYLSWVLNSHYGYHALKRIQTGALHPHLNCTFVREIICPLPPLDEQASIVSWIKRKNRMHDRLSAALRQAVRYLEEYRAALITAAVTGQIKVSTYRGEAS
jgi:type I restriction enzyme, S subunit